LPFALPINLPRYNLVLKITAAVRYKQLALP
jgi:hypothetical protein